MDDPKAQQTIVVNEETGERHHKDFPELFELGPEDPDTLLKVFLQGKKTAGENGDFIGVPNKNEKGDVESYTYRTYGQVESEAKKFAYFLEKEGLAPAEDVFGIFSANNYEYDVAIVGGYFRNLANCSLYDTLGPQAVEYICKETEMKLILVENLAKLNILYSVELPASLTTVVLIQKTEEKLPEKEGVKVVMWEEALGQVGELTVVEPGPEDLATLNYTSGTTGNPKGVMLTHKAVSITAVVAAKHYMCGQPFTSEDIWFSYLPLAHIFERMVHVMIMYCGGRLAFFGGDLTKVIAELAIVRPTVFGAVPRTLNKLFDKINARLAEPGCVAGLKAKLVRTAMSKKRAYLDQGIVTKDTIWDRKLLSLLQAQLGGRVHTLVCGAAPLDPKIRGFIREAMSVYFVEGYGQTENCAGISATMFANYCDEDGAVGTVIPCGAVRLMDVEDMNYKAKNNQGEICFKGANMMKGYYKQPEKTAETIDSEGWLHTGDIGEWTENGCLRIIDRKKHIFKTQHGEYIAPERLEGIFTKSPYVDQMFVYGNSLQAYLVAVIVPNPDKWAEIAENKEALLKQVNAFGKAEKLKGFEMIRGVVIETEPFSVENELLTPTQKAKRPVIQTKYKEALEALYTE